MMTSKKHLVIPDMQIAPDNLEINTPLLKAVGQLIVQEKPDVIVNIGDFADMPSLSSFDKKGSKKYEGKRYSDDILAASIAMTTLLEPLRRYNKARKESKKKQYRPRMVLTMGNHEHRIDRAVEEDPVHLEGVISTEDLRYKCFGWEVYPFLDRACIDGVVYSHYFIDPDGLMGRPMGCAIELALKKLGFSFTMGHQQTLKYGAKVVFNPTTLKPKLNHGLIAGSCYRHNEDYKGPQGNDHWRGVIVKDNVQNGDYDLRLIHMNSLLAGAI